MVKASLIGSWKLETYKIFWNEDNQYIYPYGEIAVGYLIYTDHYVSVHIMNAQRLNCDSNDFRQHTISEKMEMVDHYGGYVGRYEIQKDMIIHYPEVSMFPNFICNPQKRQFQLHENRLILECPYQNKENGREGYSQLVWKRIKS